MSPSQKEEKKKKKTRFLTEDQWANIFAQGFKLPQPDGEIKYSLAWEAATRAFWRYENGAWRWIDPDDLMWQLRRLIVANEPFKMSFGRDILEQMPDEIQRYDVIEDGWIAFDDGSWFPDTDDFKPHAPSRFATLRVSAAFKKMPEWNKAPLFSKFLSDICIHQDKTPNMEMQLLLQEMFGYCLMAKTERAVSFFLSGSGRNGKGVLLNLLRATMNTARVSDLSLSDLTASRFATSDLVGMRLNIADETNTSREAVSDLFKKLIAADRIKGERKFGASFSFRPRCKFIFNVNGVPTFDSFGLAMRERIITIPFWRTFDVKERVYGLADEILKKELPHIIAWAVEGLKRLQSRNLVFTQYAESEELLTNFEHLSDAFMDFLSNWETTQEDDRVTFKDFYEAYAKWSTNNGRKQLSSKKVMLRVNEQFGKAKKLWNNAEHNSVTTVPLRPKRLTPPESSSDKCGDCYLGECKKHAVDK